MGVTQQPGSLAAQDRLDREPSVPPPPKFQLAPSEGVGAQKESPGAPENLGFQEGVKVRPLSKEAAETDAASRTSFAFSSVRPHLGPWWV